MENYFFLFLNQNICCGYSKDETVLWDTQNMFEQFQFYAQQV